jgi:hypothetical protein
MIRKLEQLPWMTQQELDRIVTHANAEAAIIRSSGTPAPAERIAEPELVMSK